MELSRFDLEIAGLLLVVLFWRSQRRVGVCRRWWAATAGEFASEFEVLAVGLLEGCAQGLGFVAVLAFELIGVVRCCLS